MRASLKNALAGSLAALTIGVGLAGTATPAQAWYLHGGYHGVWHGAWHGGYPGWHAGYVWRGGYGWHGGYAWRGGYWGGLPAVGVGYVAGPVCPPGSHLGPLGLRCWPN